MESILNHHAHYHRVFQPPIILHGPRGVGKTTLIHDRTYPPSVFPCELSANILWASAVTHLFGKTCAFVEEPHDLLKFASIQLLLSLSTPCSALCIGA